MLTFPDPHLSVGSAFISANFRGAEVLLNRLWQPNLIGLGSIPILISYSVHFCCCSSPLPSSFFFTYNLVFTSRCFRYLFLPPFFSLSFLSLFYICCIFVSSPFPFRLLFVVILCITGLSLPVSSFPFT